jgi:very-short-patch-repair endonuclease
MHSHIEQLLRGGAGVVRRAEILAGIPHDALDDALRRRELIRVLPGMYVNTVTDTTLIRAAARYAGPDGALSHTTALRCWGLLSDLIKPLHITVHIHRQPRGSSYVSAHRTTHDPQVFSRDGLPLVPVERAVLESAPLLPVDQRRAVLIRALQERHTTPTRMVTALHQMPALRGRAQLAQLIELVAQGCHSELELFGYTKVFRHSSMPRFEAQYPIRLQRKTIYLDLVHEELRVAIELDGAEFHDTPAARERDRRRDVELAALGWVVLRFSARRLREDPAGVRREVLEVLAARRAQLLAS